MHRFTQIALIVLLVIIAIALIFNKGCSYSPHSVARAEAVASADSGDGGAEARSAALAECIGFINNCPSSAVADANADSATQVVEREEAPAVHTHPSHGWQMRQPRHQPSFDHYFERDRTETHAFAHAEAVAYGDDWN